ncbi:type II toxin-antitoxin system prevent-host-death family antitoxin [Magnetovirga frankeli]|uniref:type II toxin-antitoxin system Phd/YefM family antitoxin n=1 Tax=Magnetovirga frankeli TaxID=947516 RepID=UPI00129359AA|nr:type II toxin-antitoxin system prevent-host-death family antitoxin [gamma proteobacterium SS-5]
MRHVQIAEAKATLSALLARVEAGETVAITRHGRVVARLVPDEARMASELFAPLWSESDEIDFSAPEDHPPQPIAPL